MGRISFCEGFLGSRKSVGKGGGGDYVGGWGGVGVEGVRSREMKDKGND